MASVSKLFPGQTDRMGTNFFLTKFFLTARTQKLETGQKKLSITATVSIRLETPKNRIARFFCQVRFWKILGLNGGWFPDSGKESQIENFVNFFSETYSGKETRIGI